MAIDPSVMLTILIFFVALLYSSVGHAGASGYLAAMALVGIVPEVMKPTALVLNILVAGIATVQFYRAGCFSWSLFWPFTLTSIPFAFLGGYITLPGTIYKQLLGLVLLFAAYRLFSNTAITQSPQKTIPPHIALACGAGIGLLSGLIGVGGGIFLSPLLLLMGWAQIKEQSGVAAAFILVNSVAGILGHFLALKRFPIVLPYWIIASSVGGIIGSRLGSRRLGNPTLRRILAVVLVVAVLKLLLYAVPHH
ncbi:MAG: sulfite exporter TauE/SafE family protein [Nitrospirae bacterium]|nr:sulfite exporter TauE/SafE family protein [Candidatus Troglogloeales bacterium]